MPVSVYLQMLLATFLWGTAFPVAKTALQHVGPLTLAGLRFTIAGLLLLASSTVFRSQMEPAEPQGKRPVEWLRVLAISLMSTASFYGLLFLGMTRTSAASVAAIDAAGPVISVVFAHFALHDDRLSVRRGAAILLAFAGILSIALAKQGHGIAQTSLIGCGLILLGLTFNSAGTMLVVTYRGRFGIDRLTGTQMFLGGCLLLILAWILEQPLTQLRVPLSFCWLLLWLAIVSAVAFRLWYGLIRRYKVTSLTVFSFLTGLWGVALSVVFLNDRLTPQFIVGLIAVVAGVIMMNSEKTSHRRTAPVDA
ncbi:MAG: DMT family transporter [Candidatus Sumerlaeaceae bacterium]